MLRGRKSYFYKFFLNFALMLSVPLIMILVIFGYADRVVRSQILDSASKSLDRKAEQFDVTVEDMRNICFNIMGHKESQRYATYAVSMPDETDEVERNLAKMLSGYSHEKYYDIFVYYYGNNKIVSGTRSSLEAEYYYDAYYAKTTGSDFKEEFLNVIKSGSKTPYWYVMNSGGQEPYLCMAMSVYGEEITDYNYTICTVLQPEYLQTLLIMDDMEENSSFMVFDKDREQLFAGNSRIGDSWQKDSAIWDKEHGSWFDEDEYMIQIQKAQILEGYYVYVALGGAFWWVLVRLRVYCIIGIVLSILIGMAMAYRSTVRAYRPMRDLISFLKEKNGVEFNKKKESEFSYIMSLLRSNERKMKEDKLIRREWFLINFLEGKIDVTGKNRELLLQNGVDIPGENFCVCIVRADALKEEADELQDFVIRNILEEICARCGEGYLACMEKDRYVLLAELSEELEQFWQAMTEGQDFCKEHYQICLTLGYSALHDEIQQLREAYREAKEAIRYRYLFGKGVQIGYEQIRGRKFKYQANVESRLFTMLLSFVRGESDEQEEEAFLENLLEVYQIDQEASMDMADAFRMEAVSAVHKVMAICNVDAEQYRNMVGDLAEASTLTEFVACFAGLLRSVRVKDNVEVNEDIISKTKRYIDEHYNNPQLSVNMLGEKMKIQAAYLSKLFRERYDISILDYIASIRISYAKELIVQGRYSVQEIAEQVGFLSSHVFIRTFKKKEGVTPGKYRDLLGNKEE